MNLIAIDIGNSNISLAVFIDDNLAHTDHVDVKNLAPLADIIKTFRQQCGLQEFGARTVPVAVSSVNAPVLAEVERIINDVLDQKILLVGREIILQFKMAVENPDTVGTDRLLAAAAAYEVVQNAVVIADFGTATTIDCVSRQGIFLGGAILPGLKTAARSLHAFTSALPEAEIEVPQGDFGTNTIRAIQNGIYYGALGALRELVERYATQLGYWPQVVATGGFAKLIAQKCEIIDNVVPDLCLFGLFQAYKRYYQDMEESLGMTQSAPEQTTSPDHHDQTEE